MTRFPWNATVCAPAEAPAFIVEGGLRHPAGTVPLPAHRIVQNGWGRRGPSHLVGDAQKPLPTQAELTWFSFTEDRFYSARFALPTARLEAGFAQGVKAPPDGRRTPFDTLVVGVAPGGAVAVWMAAGAWTREVCTARAAPAELPFSRVLDNPAIPREEHVRQVLAEAGQSPWGAIMEPMTLSTWIRRHGRHAWQPEIDGPVTPVMLNVQGWNGEATAWLPSPPDPAAPQGAPRAIRAEWTDRAGDRRGADLDFDEAEVVEALAALAGRDRDRPVRLQIRVASDGATPEPAFRALHGTRRLRRTRIAPFRRPR